MLDYRIKQAVELWYQQHGNVECTMHNGRGLLLEIYLQHTIGKTRKQAQNSLSTLLRTIRPIIAPEKTIRFLIAARQEVGDLTYIHSSKWKAHNAINNPINNPHYNGLAKIARHEENRRLILDNPLLCNDMPTDAALNNAVQNILYNTHYEAFNGLTLVEVMDSNSFAVYTGSTKRSLNEESYRWITGHR